MLGPRVHPFRMPKDRAPSPEAMQKQEKEIGKNIPDGMKGEDDADSARH